MASSSQDIKNRPSSKKLRDTKLRDTLGELENALNSWDQIIPSADDGVASADGLADANGSNINGSRGRRNVSTGIPDEMKRRTRDLLNQLKEQIDELSSDD